VTIGAIATTRLSEALRGAGVTPALLSSTEDVCDAAGCEEPPPIDAGRAVGHSVHEESRLVPDGQTPIEAGVVFADRSGVYEPLTRFRCGAAL